MIAALAGLPNAQQRCLSRAEPPEWFAPMLATLTERRFSDPDWIFERKLDGERALAFHRGSEVRLLSGNPRAVTRERARAP